VFSIFLKSRIDIQGNPESLSFLNFYSQCWLVGPLQLSFAPPINQTSSYVTALNHLRHSNGHGYPHQCSSYSAQLRSTIRPMHSEIPFLRTCHIPKHGTSTKTKRAISMKCVLRLNFDKMVCLF